MDRAEEGERERDIEREIEPNAGNRQMCRVVIRLVTDGEYWVVITVILFIIISVIFQSDIFLLIFA